MAHELPRRFISENVFTYGMQKVPKECAPYIIIYEQMILGPLNIYRNVLA